MKEAHNIRDNKTDTTWEEESGLIEFLSRIPELTSRFNDSLGFDIRHNTAGPRSIDEDIELPLKTGFVLFRENPLVPEATYCLYSLLQNRDLYGYIGVCRNGNITTLKQLNPINNFSKGEDIMHSWLSQLVRASCEKMIL